MFIVILNTSEASISLVSIIITVFLLLTFILLQLNSTVLNPDYIGDTFEENQIPNFLLVELPTSIINEAKDIPDDSKYSRNQKNIVNDAVKNIALKFLKKAKSQSEAELSSGAANLDNLLAALADEENFMVED